MGGKTKASIFTLFASIINSVLSVVFSLIYNSLLIRTYGSEINGLIATLTQFVSMFSIIEGGFTTAAIVATYSPIVNKDYDRLNNILYTVKIVFFRIGLIITGAVLLCGSIYLRYLESPVSYLETFNLLLISVATTGISLCFLSKYSVLLQGDNREYIQVVFALIARTITWILSIVFIVHRSNILIVFALNLLNVVIIILLSNLYEKRNYKPITYKGIYDASLVSGTKDVLFQKIANTVFTSTDLVLISAFISLSYASVYALYNQVFRAILTFLISFAQAPFNSFGHLYNENSDSEKFKYYFDIYQHMVVIASTIIVTITGIMIIPFVRVYSRDFNDFNYIYPSLAVLFFSQIFSQIINRPYGIILNVSGNFKMQNFQCGIAAVINIIVSVSFIHVWGINSIILGSFVGTLVILFMNILQAYKNVLFCSPFKPLVTIVLNYAVALAIIFMSLKIHISLNGYVDLLLLAMLYSVITTIFILLFNFIIDSKNTKGVIAFLRRLLSKKIKNMDER